MLLLTRTIIILAFTNVTPDDRNIFTTVLNYTYCQYAHRPPKLGVGIFGLVVGEWVDFTRLYRGIFIVFVKSFILGANGSIKALLLELLLPCVFLVHFRAIREEALK